MSNTPEDLELAGGERASSSRNTLRLCLNLACSAGGRGCPSPRRGVGRRRDRPPLGTWRRPGRRATSPERGGVEGLRVLEHRLAGHHRPGRVGTLQADAVDPPGEAHEEQPPEQAREHDEEGQAGPHVRGHDQVDAAAEDSSHSSSRRQTADLGFPGNRQDGHHRLRTYSTMAWICSSVSRLPNPGMQPEHLAIATVQLAFLGARLDEGDHVGLGGEMVVRRTAGQVPPVGPVHSWSCRGRHGHDAARPTAAAARLPLGVVRRVGGRVVHRAVCRSADGHDALHAHHLASANDARWPWASCSSPWGGAVGVVPAWLRWPAVLVYGLGLGCVLPVTNILVAALAPARAGQRAEPGQRVVGRRRHGVAAGRRHARRCPSAAPRRSCMASVACGRRLDGAPRPIAPLPTARRRPDLAPRRATATGHSPASLRRAASAVRRVRNRHQRMGGCLCHGGWPPVRAHGRTRRRRSGRRRQPDACWRRWCCAGPARRACS